MVTIGSLLLPILIASVLVFIASALLHMVVPLHRNDYARLPHQGQIRDAIRAANVPAGNYFFPRPADAARMNSPEHQEEVAEGPSGFLTVLPPGPIAMGKSLGQWLVYLLVVGIFVAYVASRTLVAGAEYMEVFRLVGTVAFLTYAGSAPADSIWTGREWSTTFKNVLDGLIYGLLTAGAFAGFWPGG